MNAALALALALALVDVTAGADGFSPGTCLSSRYSHGAMPSIFDSPAFTARLFYPRPDTSAPPRGAHDQLIDVGPGVRLHVRVHPAPSARALVLLFHGNGEVISDYDAAAPTYAEAGARLAVADYRGYGASSGEPTLRSCIADAPAIAAAARATTTLPLVVMGRSLGSACAAELARSAPAPAGMILESGLTDLHALARRHGIASDGPFSADDHTVFDPLPKLRACTSPLLVLHSANDTLIPPAEATAAHDAAGTADKRLVFIPGRGHNDVSFHALYWKTLRAFVDHVAGG